MFRNHVHVYQSSSLWQQFPETKDTWFKKVSGWDYMLYPLINNKQLKGSGWGNGTLLLICLDSSPSALCPSRVTGLDSSALVFSTTSFTTGQKESPDIPQVELSLQFWFYFLTSELFPWFPQRPPLSYSPSPTFLPLPPHLPWACFLLFLFPHAQNPTRSSWSLYSIKSTYNWGDNMQAIFHVFFTFYLFDAFYLLFSPRLGSS